MARIRTIKPDFWTSEQIVECSVEARLMFIGLWNFCDDGGIHPASTRRIKMEIYPGDDFKSEDVRRMLDELSTNKLIKLYMVDNVEYLIVTGWKTHQRIDRPTLKYPPPIDETNTPIRRTFDDRSPPEGKGREGNGREGSGFDEHSSRDLKNNRKTEKTTFPADKQKRFVKPSLEEVTQYCKQRGKGVDPEQWMNHYTSNGWKVGKNGMKDWKAAVRTWEKSDISPTQERQGPRSAPLAN